jgi:hypothetical protein
VVIGSRENRFSYTVTFVCGEQAEEECRCGPVRPGRYATEIAIHNLNHQEVRLEKRILPLVLLGAARGREPASTRPTAIDRMILPPNTATMDDCCRLAELLLGAQPMQPLPLTIGLIEIVSSQQLEVTVVYTASDLTSSAVSIDVEHVRAALVS